MKANGFSTLLRKEIRFKRGESKKSRSNSSRSNQRERSGYGDRYGSTRGRAVESGLDTRRTEIEAKHELTLTEALRGIPGVRVQQQGSPGALTTLRLRGQRNFDTALLLDGFRVRDAGDINGSALSLMADLVPVALNRVEVLRGAGSSIYGTHAIGGVVNLIPALARPDFISRRISMEAVSNVPRTHAGIRRWRTFGFELGVNRLDVRDGIDGDDAYAETPVSQDAFNSIRHPQSPSLGISTATSQTLA